MQHEGNEQAYGSNVDRKQGIITLQWINIIYLLWKKEVEIQKKGSIEERKILKWHNIRKFRTHPPI